ncbi:MAG: class I SAM-dependent methyltransferase, partial [Trueperaceae bacterium]|nr:class I SAM-dependent methyltransferase [Trueperaceae bacterium]
RYTEATGFDAVHKLEDPGFLLPLLEALERVRPPGGGRVLVLGCHRGDEMAALGLLEPAPSGLEVVGVDHAAGPLAEAQARFASARFVLGDVAALDPALGRFDLVVAVAVLQSRGVDDRALLRHLVQAHVAEAGALLIGVPASRFRAHDVVWGARTRNYREADLSLAVQDLAVYRRYLHQHRFRTHVGGRYDLLLTAWRGR